MEIIDFSMRGVEIKDNYIEKWDNYCNVNKKKDLKKTEVGTRNRRWFA
jgi:hypothetical protein